jgi:hypothetical protein
MPDIFPRRTWPTLAGAEAGKYLASAHGAFLASAFDYFDHLALIRHLGRPEVDKTWNYDYDPLTTSPVGSNQDLQVRLLCPPFAAHIFVAVQYHASPFAVSAPDLVALGGPPVMRIVSTLETYPGGVAIDSPGMRWDYQDRTLPPTVRVNGADWVEGAVNPNLANATYPPRWVLSGVDANDAPPAAVTRPRPLNVGSGAGAICRIRFVATNARLSRAKIWVLPEAVVSV